MTWPRDRAMPSPTYIRTERLSDPLKSWPSAGLAASRPVDGSRCDRPAHREQLRCHTAPLILIDNRENPRSVRLARPCCGRLWWDRFRVVRATKYRDVVAVLRAHGWVLLRTAKGSHEIWGLPDESVKGVSRTTGKFPPACCGRSPPSCPRRPRSGSEKGGPVMDVTIHEVEATREGRWWVLSVEDLGIAGQVRKLDEAAEVARSLVAAYLGQDEAGVDIEVHVTLPAEAAALLAEAAEEEDQARATLAAAGAKRRDAVAALRAEGMSQREVARALGVSPQRVSQLAKESAA